MRMRIPIRIPARFLAAIRQARSPLGNQKGIALLMATACIMMISYFALELSYDSNVEYQVNSKSLNRLKAYYAAKSAVQLSLLRIKVYQQAQSKFGQQLGNSAMLDQIWQFPFAWPLPLPPEMNSVDKESFDTLTKESIMDASYLVTIEDEGSKIDINDLASPSKTLREATARQLLAIFQQKIKEDEVFGREYGQYRFEELINKITDWMSAKAQSANGGDKRQAFAQLNADSQTNDYPPNRAFRTLSELHMIPGMTDVLYNILEPRITIYGMKGINPNIATKEVLKSLDPGMTEESVNEAIKRRGDPNEGGPFKNENDFWDFVSSKGARLEGNPKPTLIFDSIMNFRIRANGEFAGSSREITAIVMDFNKTAAKVKSYMDKDKQGQNPAGAAPGAAAPGAAPGANPGAQKPAAVVIPKGPPRIVYWNEK